MSQVVLAATPTILQHNAAGSHAVTSQSVAFSGNLSSDSEVIVSAGSWCPAASPGTLSISDSAGHTFVAGPGTTKLASGTSSSVFQDWYATNSVASADTVTVTSSTSCDVSVYVTEVSNIAGFDVQNGAVATGTSSASGSITTINAADFLYVSGFDQTTSGDTWSASSGYSLLPSFNNTAGGESLDVGNQNVSVTGSYSNTWTINVGSNGFHSHIIAFKASGATPTPTPTSTPTPTPTPTPSSSPTPTPSPSPTPSSFTCPAGQAVVGVTCG